MNHIPYGPYEKYIKRPLDCVLATGALVVLSPIMGVTAIVVKRKLGSPVIFKQQRPGKDEKIFNLYKFRTMTDEKDADGNLLPDTLRTTNVGNFMRKTSLDELPELVNIIRGDMAIVGPRPLLVQYLPYYSEEERRRHSVRPGLTGLAQVNGRNFINWNDKLRLDSEYVDKITLLKDLKILTQTIVKVLKKDDVADLADEVETYLDEERKKKQ